MDKARNKAIRRQGRNFTHQKEASQHSNELAAVSKTRSRPRRWMSVSAHQLFFAGQTWCTASKNGSEKRRSRSVNSNIATPTANNNNGNAACQYQNFLSNFFIMQNISMAFEEFEGSLVIGRRQIGQPVLWRCRNQ